jgi:hypothetical protein
MTRIRQSPSGQFIDVAGGPVSVANYAELAALEAEAGSQVVVRSVGDVFIYYTNVMGEDTGGQVLSDYGGVWFRQYTTNRNEMLDYYIDPDSGNDENLGTADLPLQTFGEFASRIRGLPSIDIPITVLILGNLPSTDPINLQVKFGDGGQLIIAGDPTITNLGALEGYTRTNTSTNTQCSITKDVLGSFTNGVPLRLVNSGTTYYTSIGEIGIESATISTPVTAEGVYAGELVPEDTQLLEVINPRCYVQSLINLSGSTYDDKLIVRDLSVREVPLSVATVIQGVGLIERCWFESLVVGSYLSFTNCRIIQSSFTSYDLSTGGSLWFVGSISDDNMVVESSSFGNSTANFYLGNCNLTGCYFYNPTTVHGIVVFESATLRILWSGVFGTENGLFVRGNVKIMASQTTDSLIRGFYGNVSQFGIWAKGAASIGYQSSNALLIAAPEQLTFGTAAYPVTSFTSAPLATFADLFAAPFSGAATSRQTNAIVNSFAV